MSIRETITTNVLILAVIISLLLAFVTSLIFGYPEYAAVALGALAAWVGGNYNGRRTAPVET